MPVDTTHYQYDKYQPQWKRLRDVIEGQDVVHLAGDYYLPKLSGQDQHEYKAYVKRALLYGATSRTLDGLSGMVFRVAPSTELPPGIVEFENNITLDGLSLSGFAEQLIDDVLAVGRCGILVDHPDTTGQDLSQADAEILNIRPFMKHYKTESIINWKTQGVQNNQVLTEVRLSESVSVQDPEDEFSNELVEQIRVLDLFENKYRQRIYRKDDKKKKWVQLGGDIFPLKNGVPLDKIPFYFVGVKNGSADVEKPPLIDLADVNLSHYRTMADLEHGAHFTALPTAVVTGLSPVDEEDEGEAPEYRIGSATAWLFSNPDTDVKYLEFQGSGLSALEQRAKAKEEYMAFLGAKMLSPDKRTVEAAETAQIHRQGENSVLASISQSVSQSIEAALIMFLEWRGTEGGEVRYQLNKDFIPVIMSAQDLTALVQTWQAGGIAFDDLVWNLKRGEIIRDERQPEDLLSEIETENPFGEMPRNPIVDVEV